MQVVRSAGRRLRRWLTWRTVALALLAIPVAALALVGLSHVVRDPQLRTDYRFDTRGGAMPNSGPEFRMMLELLAGISLTPGNAIELLNNGDETYPRLWNDLRSAQRSITLQFYYAGDGAVADSATRILAERARAGVAVYFMFDAYGGSDLPRPYLDSLRSAGVNVAAFRPVRWYAMDRGNHRSHVRGVIVDGAIAYTGGFGLDDKWLGGGRKPGEWRETNVRFAGPAVMQLHAAFIAEWAEAAGELPQTMRLRPVGDGAETVPGRSSTAGLLYSPSVTGSSPAERLLAVAIESARERLYITNAYFVPQPHFVRMLAAAARRGVDVRVLTNGPRSDVRVTWLAGRSRYPELLAAGVRMYEYEPTTLHAKTIVVDGVLGIVGTMNFDNRSLAYNSEVALIATDSVLGARMESQFMEDIRLANAISPAAFSRRPRLERFLEWAAGLFASFM